MQYLSTQVDSIISNLLKSVIFIKIFLLVLRDGKELISIVVGSNETIELIDIVIWDLGPKNCCRFRLFV